MTLAQAVSMLKNCPLAQYNSLKAELIQKYGQVGLDASRLVDHTSTGG